MDMLQIIQPEINLLGLRIQDPVNALTDIMLGFVCIYAYFKLNKRDNRAYNLMRYYFLLFGCSVIFSAIFGHAFTYTFNKYWKLSGWILTLFSVLIIEFAALNHAQSSIKPKIATFIRVLIYFEMTVLLFLTIYYIDFKYVTVHSFFGIILVFMPLHVFIYKKEKNMGAKYMIYAVFLLILTLFIYKIPIVIDVYFNHKDLAHFVISASVLLMLKGTQVYYENQRKKV